MNFNLPNFERLLNRKSPEINEELFENLDIKTNHDVIDEIIKQNQLLRDTLISIDRQNGRLSKINTRLTVFAIFISVLFGLTSAYDVFTNEDYTQEILLEQKQLNEIMQKNTEQQIIMFEELVSRDGQLLEYLKSSKTNQTTDEKNVP